MITFIYTYLIYVWFFFVRNCFFNRLIGFGQLKKNIRANSIYDHVISAHISHSIHIFFFLYSNTECCSRCVYINGFLIWRIWLIIFVIYSTTKCNALQVFAIFWGGWISDRAIRLPSIVLLLTMLFECLKSFRFNIVYKSMDGDR